MNAKVTTHQIRVQQDVLINTLRLIELTDERIALKEKQRSSTDQFSATFIANLERQIANLKAARERVFNRYERHVYKLAVMMKEHNSKLSIVSIQQS